MEMQVKVLIHSNGPHVPSGYGQQARLAGAILRDLGHEVAFSCFSGLGGQPIRWEGYTLFPMGMLEFGVDTIAGHARTWGADLVIPIMDLWKLAPVARELGDAPFLVAPLLITDCEAVNGGPGVPDQQVLGMLMGYPAAVSMFGVARLEAVGVKTYVVPHTFDPAVFRPMPEAERAALRDGNSTAGKFVIGIHAANNDALRKGFIEQFAAFARFSAKHPDAMLNVFSIYNTARGHNLVELAADMGISDKVMWMPTYEQVAGLLGDEFVAAWYNSVDVLSMCSYAEGFGIPAIQAQACGTPVVATDCSALTELVRPAGWLVKGTRFWNPVHHAWWTRPDEGEIVKAWEKAYRERGNPERAARAVAHAAGYAYDRVRDECWAPWLAKCEQVIRVLGEAKTGVVNYDGLKWKAENLTTQFGDTLALEHESDYAPYITGRLREGSVFVDVGAHVGHWTVRAAALGARVTAVEADPVTCERLYENLKLNGLEAEVFSVAAWDEVTTLRLLHQNQEKYDGTNQVRPYGDGPEVSAEPLDITLGHLDRIDLIKVDVEGADLHVLRGLRKTLERTRPAMFIEDHSVYGYFDHADLEALLTDLGYQWETVAKGYLLAVPRAG
jgi:FkbM family methyltransferase